MPTKLRRSRVPRPRERAELRHSRITLSDGTRVGLTVAGRGVPLVFFHGIGFNRYAYSEVLRRLATRGFLVAAWDAPGHGHSSSPFGADDTFEARVRITERIIDELGIGRAVLVGHSMGGRMAVELAASRPDRTIAAVLVSAAVGADFDESRNRVDHFVSRITGTVDAVADTLVEQLIHRRPGPFWYVRMTAITAKRFLAEPSWLSHVVRAVTGARLSDAPLELVRKAGVPTFVVHGARDKVVPYASGVDAAVRSGAVMIGLPAAYHSWLMASPASFMAVVDHLLEHELGDAIGKAMSQRRSTSGASNDGERQRRLLAKDARIVKLAPSFRLLPTRDAFGNRRIYHFSRALKERTTADRAGMQGLA